MKFRIKFEITIKNNIFNFAIVEQSGKLSQEKWSASDSKIYQVGNSKFRFGNIQHPEISAGINNFFHIYFLGEQLPGSTAKICTSNLTPNFKRELISAMKQFINDKEEIDRLLGK